MTTNEIADYLTTEERDRLIECERQISTAIRAFYQVGAALKQVKADRLYRERYKTFEHYCLNRWGISRSRAYQLIDCVEVINNIAEMMTAQNAGRINPPTSVAQTAPLARVAPEKQLAAWTEAVETANGGNVTGRNVETVARKYVAPGRTSFQHDRNGAAARVAKTAIRQALEFYARGGRDGGERAAKALFLLTGEVD